ncbi:MAG: DUF4037 domain-containing protein [Phycisphaerae bacterium]|nr:DUF4037 domain-containing protein [Phycisphaerae bacterium]
MARFIPGLKLSEMFFKEAVRPILYRHWPHLKYSAALIGYGSDVIGFDTPMSRDHEWGPRVRLFLTEEDHRILTEPIKKRMANELPRVFKGYSTHFHRPVGADCFRLGECTDGAINHRVEIFTIHGYFHGRHGINPDRPMTVPEWLITTEQSLLELTAGGVFHDGLKQLVKIRTKLRYYPRDVWLYLLACQWMRIDQEESMVGRAGMVEDDLGSRIIASRMVRDIMRLCFLMERKYAPYSKWFGSAFGRLKCASEFVPILEKTLSATSWKARERHLANAYELVAGMHNALMITEPLEISRRRFHGRPFTVIAGARFTEAIRKKIRCRFVRNLRQNIGSVDQFSDSCDLLDNPLLSGRLSVLYSE